MIGGLLRKLFGEKADSPDAVVNKPEVATPPPPEPTAEQRARWERKASEAKGIFAPRIGIERQSDEPTSVREEAKASSSAPAPFEHTDDQMARWQRKADEAKAAAPKAAAPKADRVESLNKEERKDALSPAQPTAPSQLQIAMKMAVAQLMAVERGQTFKVTLGKPADYQDGLSKIFADDSLSVLSEEDNPLAIYVATANGELVGELPRKGKLIEAVRGGMVIVAARVASVREPDLENELYRATVEIDCVSEEDTKFFDVRRNKQPETTQPRSYPVQIVGEQHYQDAIAGLNQGDTVTLWHEPNNPYDDEAIAVARDDGATLGYIPSDSWLRRALLDEGKGCTATVQTVGQGKRGFVEIELAVVLDGEPIDER